MYDPAYGETPVTDTTYATRQATCAPLFSRSLYAKDSIHLTDQWIAVLGALSVVLPVTATVSRSRKMRSMTKTISFLPQAGLVYKLTPNLSLYGNYSRSFTPSTAIDDNGNVATPETGTT